TNESGDTSSATAFAREALSKKGMDESQITGAASSYARKYALGGLFAIDNNDDADKLNNNKEYSLPVMSDNDFNAALKQYGGSVSSGEKKGEDFIAWLSAQYTLTNEQEQAIKQLEPANASA
ncbi:MAG: ERF family protein, partial [Pseudomonadota bacterium]|nr:ERF family protein [Pseudomonadota bacterium]